MGSMSGFGGNPFNFKELSMKKSSSDYFNMKPIRGSSPTASLAADLSQNFHIDQRYVMRWEVLWGRRSKDDKGTTPLLTLYLVRN